MTARHWFWSSLVPAVGSILLKTHRLRSDDCCGSEAWQSAQTNIRTQHTHTPGWPGWCRVSCQHSGSRVFAVVSLRILTPNTSWRFCFAHLQWHDGSRWVKKGKNTTGEIPKQALPPFSPSSAQWWNQGAAILKHCSRCVTSLAYLTRSTPTGVLLKNKAQPVLSSSPFTGARSQHDIWVFRVPLQMDGISRSREFRNRGAMERND